MSISSRSLFTDTRDTHSISFLKCGKLDTGLKFFRISGSMPNVLSNRMINASFRLGGMTPCSNYIHVCIVCVSTGTRTLSSTFRKEVELGLGCRK